MKTLDNVIAFIPTKNADQSKAFYQNNLGLSFVSDDQFALVFNMGQTMLRVVRVQDFTPAPFTILGWEVPNIEESVRDLSSKKISFERYPWLDQDELGIWKSPSGSRIAWFKDPDGNVLSVAQH
jgi:catechol 2,3-dioxygenase-like lactoylglutathione lyase family enzyme